MTLRGHLAFSESADERHEFHALPDDPERGRVSVVHRVGEPHAVLSANLMAAIGTGLRGSGCRGMSNGMRIYAPGLNPRRRGGARRLFADASVRCGEPEFAGPEHGEAPGKRDTLLNPVVLFEILSPSTAAYDLGEKFVAYSAIPSFREYVVIHQDRRVVETRVRRDDGTWALRVHLGAPEGDATEVHLESLSIRLRLDDLYEDVDPDADDAG